MSESENPMDGIEPEDATPAEGGGDYRDLAPGPDTPQDPVEDPDADREPGPTKS
jgi:hypothetical protein